MFSLVSNEDYNILKYRWEQQLAKGCPDIDERIVESLKRFNTIDGVVSIWSCSGHTKAEHFVTQGNVRTYTGHQERYILFVVNKQGISVFDALSAYMMQMDRGDWALVRPMLNTSLLTWCFGNGTQPSHLTADALRLYPCWRISMHYNNLTKRKSKMAKVIHDEMERIWLEMIDFIVKELV